MLITVFGKLGMTGVMGCSGVDESERACAFLSAVGMDELDWSESLIGFDQISE